MLCLMPAAMWGQGVGADNAGGDLTECTTVTVGRAASADGAVMTSHSDDSGRRRTDIAVVPAKDHPRGAVKTIYHSAIAPDEKGRMPRYRMVATGQLPEAPHTYQYFNSAYPCLNEKQLAIGEATFGGRRECVADTGLIDINSLCMLLLERCTTARQAIRTAGELMAEYGYNDVGECLTIADPREVWHLEIVGPGKKKIGAVWVAQRVPDDHVSVNANAARIEEIDLDDADSFMASDNIFAVAEANGWYDPRKETFRFAYAYAPTTRTSLACRRREWRVFNLLAPSLKLDPNSEHYPFSVKPDSLVSKADVARVFRDYYEGTEFDNRAMLTVADADGRQVISPMANPFMNRDEQRMLRIRGERTIAVPSTVYATILQCRSWLPDEVGALCWFALDNAATSVYVPFYGNVRFLPQSYATDGRETGFSREAAWWAFNRLGTLASQRWGEMKPVVDSVWMPMQAELFDRQDAIEAEAIELLRQNKRNAAIDLLTRYSNECANRAVDTAWATGDLLWTVFDGKW